MKLNLIEVANAVATLVLVAVLAWAKLRERRIRRENDLPDNPTSCTDHEKRLRTIEGAIAKINTNIALIRFKLGMGEDE
jgi:hypothetical protein